MLEKLFSGGAQTAPIAIPLAFRMSEERSIHLLPDAYEPLPTWRFLSHHIRRYPLDLRAHVQRILLAGGEPIKGRLEGSLLDLFLALGESGMMLKETMLKKNRAALGEEAHQFFFQWLTEGPTGGMDKEWRPGSMLATGETVVPQKLLSVQRDAEASSYGSVMEEVQACMEYGQIDMAQELLEQEVLAGRGDEGIEQELLNIYQYTRNRAKLNGLTDAMAAAGIQPSNLWKELQHEAGNW